MRRQLRAVSVVGAAVAILVVPLSAWAQTPAVPAAPVEQAAAPRIEFESVEHDFGKAVSGAQLKTTFTFRNTGSAPLSIQSVKGG